MEPRRLALPSLLLLLSLVEYSAAVVGTHVYTGGVLKIGKPLSIKPKPAQIPAGTWGMVPPGGQPAKPEPKARAGGQGLFPNPVPSALGNLNRFFRTKSRNGTATNNLPGAANFQPGHVRLPSAIQKRRPDLAIPKTVDVEHNVRAYFAKFNKKPAAAGNSTPGAEHPSPLPLSQPGTIGDAAAQAQYHPEQAGQMFVSQTETSKHDVMKESGTIDVLGSVPSGRHYQTYVDVPDGGNLSIVFAACTGHLEVDVHVNEESLFDYSNMRRRRRQSHGLNLRYRKPFVHAETGLGVSENDAALGTMTEFELDAGRYYVTIVNEGEHLGQFGLFATRHLAAMIYPILPEDPMIKVSAIRPTQLLVSWPAVLDASTTNIEYCIMATESAVFKQRVVTNACDRIRDMKRRADPKIEPYPMREQVCTSQSSIQLGQLKPSTAYHVELEARNKVTGRYVPYIPTRAVTSEKGLPLEDSAELLGTTLDGYSRQVFTFDTTHLVADRAPLSITIASCNALHGWMVTRDGIYVANRAPPSEQGHHHAPASDPAKMIPNSAIIHALHNPHNASFSEPHLQQSSYESVAAERGIYQLTVFNHGPQRMKVDIFATISPLDKPFPTVPQDSDILVQNLSCDSAILNWHEGLGTTNITYCLQLTVGYEPSLSNNLNRCNLESAFSTVYDLLQGKDCSAETERTVQLTTRNMTDPITAEVVAVNTYTRRIVVYPPSTFLCNSSFAALRSSTTSVGYSLTSILGSLIFTVLSIYKD